MFCVEAFLQPVEDDVVKDAGYSGFYQLMLFRRVVETSFPFLS